MEAGTLLAHYRVTEKIGAGGMGEVYAAKDEKLGRDVALKILPPEFAADSERVARFQREAKTLASLHHPNIASIFGFETTDEATFLVMELVEGEDLSEMLKSGAPAVDEAVDIARQIAEGLEDAHEKGIVHRDLKPANVKRTPDGKVKILDFGLARVFAGQTTGEEEVGSAVTMTAGMTQAGTVLGTAAYMSPEQARGKEVDRRTDIWAFGVILFEMLTGRQLFAGETATDTLAGILKSEPDWDTLPDGLPPQVERVLRRCLSKEPRQRLRDIGEARVRLEDPAAESGLFTGSFAAVTDEPGTRRGLPAFVPWAVVVLCLAALGWFGATGGFFPAERPVWHMGFQAPEGREFHISTAFPAIPQISPDGQHVVFGGFDRETSEASLYVRSLDGGRAVRLDGTQNGQYPFWSPDSEWIGFFDRNQGLKKIRVSGGPTQLICPATNAKGGTWSVDGNIIFTPNSDTGLMIVPDIGGTPEPMTEVGGETGFDSHRHPCFLPDGKRYLYFARAQGGQESHIRLGTLGQEEFQVVMNSGTGVVFANGHLFYLSQQTLMAQPFDPQSGQLTGRPAPLAENVLILPGAALAGFSVSHEGSLTYLEGEGSDDASLAWLDRRGQLIENVGERARYDTVKLSPDGRLAAVTIVEGNGPAKDIWILDIERQLLTRFTNNPGDDRMPTWLQDSRTLLFNSDRDGQYRIYRKTVGDLGNPQMVFEMPGPIWLWDCARDDRSLLIGVSTDSTNLDLWSADLLGEAEPRQLVATPAADGAAKFSPDGKWVGYWSTGSGLSQNFAAPWPAMTPVTQLSTSQGTWHFWREDMSAVVVQEGEGRLLEVPLVINGNDLRAGTPVQLFDHVAVKLDGAWLEMAPDGQNFLAISVNDLKGPKYVDLVSNWPALMPDD